MGTEANVICAGVFEIPPGVTTGIAMVIEPADSWNYTNGNGLNQVYNNGQLEIRTGSSYQPAFTPAGNFNAPRVWNGTVYYDIETLTIPTLSEWGFIAMAGVLGIIGLLAIRRRKATV